MIKEKQLAIIGIMVILLSAGVMAFGVTPSHFGEHELRIMPGEKGTAYFELQNMVGDEDYQVTATMTLGEEIARITDKETIYEVPAMTEGIRVNLEVTIPQNANIGDTYLIEMAFRAAPKSSGPLTMGTSIKNTIPIIIGEKKVIPENVLGPARPARGRQEIPESDGGMAITIAVITIILALIILIITLRKKEGLYQKNSEIFKKGQ